MTGAEPERLAMIETYLKAQGLFRTYDGSQKDPSFSGDIMELDLASVQPSLSGPKRPHDHVYLKEMQKDFKNCLDNKVGFKGFAIPKEK